MGLREKKHASVAAILFLFVGWLWDILTGKNR
jgi:hypothetical protein